MTSLSISLGPSLFSPMKPVWNKEDPDEFLDGHSSLDGQILESSVDRAIEDLHELHRILGSPGSRFWHTRQACPLVFMAHLPFFGNKL